MPSIERIYDRYGNILRYRLSVSDGSDSDGNQIRHRLNWLPPNPEASAEEMDAQAWAAAYQFEERIKFGYRIDRRITFREYAEYVLDLKQRTGVKPSTLDRYRSMLPRIYKHIGNLQMSVITPFHLNDMYKELAGESVREEAMRATARKSLRVCFESTKMSRQELARVSRLSASTVGCALNGTPIMVETAAAIAKALGSDVKELFTIRSNVKPLAPKTILEHHRLISTIFSQAEKELIVLMNPAARATPPRAKTPKRDYYQPEQMDAILEALEDVPLKWKAITYLLIDTGCRRGEIMGLKWTDVNFKTGVIIIDSALLYSKDLGIYEGETKTGDFRAIKLAQQSLDVLVQWKKEYDLWEKLNGDRWVNSGFVFVQDNGAPMHPDSITDWLNKFGIEHNLPHLHPHAFRHTAASTMIANGVDLVTTAAELGHKDATTTAKIYAHQIAIARANAADVRAGVFSTRNNRD